MQLMTEELKRVIPPLRTTECQPDPVVVAKFFDPCGSWTWYVLEGEPDDEDFMFFGLVHGFEVELGYFTLSELQSVRGPLGIGLERDIHFQPTPLRVIRDRISR